MSADPQIDQHIQQAELVRRQEVQKLLDIYETHSIDLNTVPNEILETLIENPELTCMQISNELRTIRDNLPLTSLSPEGLHSVIYLILKTYSGSPSAEEQGLLFHILFSPIFPDSELLEQWKTIHRPLREFQAREAVIVIERAEQDGKKAVLYADAPMRSAKTFFKEQSVSKLRAKGYNVIDMIFEPLVEAGGRSRIAIEDAYKPEGFDLSPEEYNERLNSILSKREEDNINVVCIDEFTFVANGNSDIFDKFIQELTNSGFHVVLTGLGSDYLAGVMPLAQGVYDLEQQEPYGLKFVRVDCRAFSILQGDDYLSIPRADKTARYVAYKDENGEDHYLIDIHHLPLFVPEGDPRVRYVCICEEHHPVLQIDHLGITGMITLRYPPEGNPRQQEFKAYLGSVLEG